MAVKKAHFDALTSGSLLEETISGLAAKDDYRKELGTLARARTDFEALSKRAALHPVLLENSARTGAGIEAMRATLAALALAKPIA